MESAATDLQKENNQPRSERNAHHFGQVCHFIRCRLVVELLGKRVRILVTVGPLSTCCSRP